MNLRVFLWSGLGVAALVLAVGVAWIFTLPPQAAGAAPLPIARDEADATVAALRPPKRQRPLIAIIGLNDATETTDYLMPYGILRRADIADVMALATGPGTMTLYPALKVEPQATIAVFDARHPEGADYVIVPAMSRDDDPAVLNWIRSQRAKGAIVVGICAGGKIVGAAGLLDGKRATTHWYSVDGLRRAHSTMHYVADRRFVVDDGVATTTGISASMSATLALIEAIAGRDKAEAVARDLGVAQWDARHDSNAFSFTRPFALTVMGNALAFWKRETLGIELEADVDEVSLALVADAWSRTYRSQAVTFARSAEARETRSGLRIIPDEVAASWPAAERLAAVGSVPPAEELDRTLRTIAGRYGGRTADLVAMQLEYRQPEGSR